MFWSVTSEPASSWALLSVTSYSPSPICPGNRKKPGGPGIFRHSTALIGVSRDSNAGAKPSRIVLTPPARYRSSSSVASLKPVTMPVRLHWRSQSTRMTRLPLLASAHPRLRTVVVFPTPPFWLKNAILATMAAPLGTALSTVPSDTRAFLHCYGRQNTCQEDTPSSTRQSIVFVNACGLNTSSPLWSYAFLHLDLARPDRELSPAGCDLPCTALEVKGYLISLYSPPQ